MSGITHLIRYNYDGLVHEVIEKIGRCVQRAQLEKLRIQKKQFLKTFKPRQYDALIYKAASEEICYSRLFNYRPILLSTARIIQDDATLEYPELIELRLLIAKAEKKAENLLRRRIFSPVPPSQEQILRARVASYNHKSREIVGALKQKIAKTERCPYCNTLVS